MKYNKPDSRRSIRTPSTLVLVPLVSRYLLTFCRYCLYSRYAEPVLRLSDNYTLTCRLYERTDHVLYAIRRVAIAFVNMRGNVPSIFFSTVGYWCGAETVRTFNTARIIEHTADTGNIEITSSRNPEWRYRRWTNQL